VGKLLLIGSEKVEVWSSHCTDSHRCIQCFFVGKYPCARRGRQPGLPSLSYGMCPPSPKSHDVMYRMGQWVSIEANAMPYNDFNQFDIAQPLIPISDGGCVEEMTQRLKVESEHIHRSLSRTIALTRYTNKPCPRCSYPYSKSRGGQPNWTYYCPQCQREWTDNPNYPLLQNHEIGRYPIYIKDFAIKRKQDGVMAKNIRQEINIVYHIEVYLGTIKLWTAGIYKHKRDEIHHTIIEAHYKHPGLSRERISKMFGIPKTTVYRTLKSLEGVLV